jgi:hypothetical protein
MQFPMKAIPIRYVIKERLDHDAAAARATEALAALKYRNIVIEQSRPFEDQEAISVYAVADHDLKRPPGILTSMRAVVVIDGVEANNLDDSMPEPILDLQRHGME